MSVSPELETTDSPEVVTTPELSTVSLSRAELEPSVPFPQLVIARSDFQIREANVAFLRLIGEEASEIIGKPLAEILPEKAAKLCLRLLTQVSESGTVVSVIEPSPFAPRSDDLRCLYTVWSLENSENQFAITFQVLSVSSEARAHEKAVLANEALVRSLIQQNELVTALNVRLQRAMQETHHRVKNNLQVIAALALVQLKPEETMISVDAVHRVVGHVHTLAHLHDLLTQQILADPDAEMLNTQETLSDLIPLLQANVPHRTLRASITAMQLPISKSASLSLLVSELVSNAVKHGAGDIEINLTQENLTGVLTVCDLGRGFPEGFDPMRASNTGIKLIFSMARFDLKGDIEFFNGAKGGACVSVKFPISL